jgi:hypothetical protein
VLRNALTAWRILTLASCTDGGHIHGIGFLRSMPVVMIAHNKIKDILNDHSFWTLCLIFYISLGLIYRIFT